MKNLMISCEKATMLIVKSEESNLSFGLKISLKLHLFFCKFCKLFAKQNKFISQNIPHTDDIHFTEAEKNTLIQKLNN